MDKTVVNTQNPIFQSRCFQGIICAKRYNTVVTNACLPYTTSKLFLDLDQYSTLVYKKEGIVMLIIISRSL